ncbi:MAG: kynureninase [Saprospiraceae bacterium]|nr:kynureninase [Saprospiraceae bacterium]
MNDSIPQFAELDAQDPLAGFREKFLIPVSNSTIGGTHKMLYFCGNSLGLQPVSTRDYIRQELDDWARFGVEGHLQAMRPWVSYHEILTEDMAAVVGAKPSEVVVMNTLSVNLHLMMVSFYRPKPGRSKILIEYSAFPSDRYAVESQIRFHGYDPEIDLIILQPENEDEYVNPAYIQQVIKQHGESIALILIGSVNYYTGQAYPIRKITEWGHAQGCVVGFDLAHGAGNLLLNLHEDGPDFAVWCSYKYLNSGPGSLAGCFVHERHSKAYDLPRFAGWWGHNKQRRFLMEPKLDLLPGAEGWQLSNPPILPMACIRASLDLFKEAGMPALRTKSLKLHKYLRDLMNSLDHPEIRLLTPEVEEEHGSQVSIQIKNANKEIYHQLSALHIIADWREPDVIRVAPVPLYNSFEDVHQLYSACKKVLKIQ